MPGRLDKDHELIKRAQQGDRHAFGDLYETYASPIFRYLFSHLNNLMDAEDLTAEVFLKAWRSLPKYIQQGIPFQAFLFRIAHNVMVDHYRQISHYEHKSPDEMDSFKAEAVLGTGEVAGRQLEHQEILHVLSQLRPDYQSVLTLRFVSGLTPDETSLVMNRSVGAIRVLQHRALIALRKIMDTKG